MRQLHSATYKNPTQLQQGATLVFGASHSGYDIAYELGGTVRPWQDRTEATCLWESPIFKVAIPVVVFLWGSTTSRTEG